MPPEERFVCRFAAEPPQDLLPYGRWAATLREHFIEAVENIEAEDDEEVGEPQSMIWFPDRTWGGRTFIPVTCRTTGGFELFGYVSYIRGDDDAEGPEGEPSDFYASADYTSETADKHPEWTLDLNEEVVGSWRGENGTEAEMTLVWGVPQVPGGAIATAELADLAVDQCVLIEDRFTLIAPDNFRQDFLDIKLFDRGGKQLAAESLYDEDGADDDPDAGVPTPPA